MAKELEKHGVPRTNLPGSVQGIDLKRRPQEWAWLDHHLSDECRIFCVDFSPQQVSVQPNLSGIQLSSFLAKPRPPWSRVRWINIDGVNWGVVQALALAYDVHPLAVEDVVHIPQRIKADFYEHLMYCSLHLITLAEPHLGDPVPELGRASAPELGGAATIHSTPAVPSAHMNMHGHSDLPPPATSQVSAPPVLNAADLGEGRASGQLSRASMTMHATEADITGADPLAKLPARRLGRPTSLTRRYGTHQQAEEPPAPTGPQRVGSVLRAAAGRLRSAEARDARLGAGCGVPVHKQQVSIFLINSNTIVSIFQTSGVAVTRPLLQQLRSPGTLARDAADASYLLCLLLDALVDSAYPVVDAYSDSIMAAEARITDGKPTSRMTRELHLVQADLATMRHTMLPTLHLVTQLRSHVADARSYITRPPTPLPTAAPPAQPPGSSDAAVQGAPRHAPEPPAPPPPPLISKLTRTYLSDVQDHLTTLIDTLDSQVDACRDLIDLTFNLIALGTNESMQALTVVSVLFLPLTFVAGIYGMNFTDVASGEPSMPELKWRYGYAYFFGVCGFVIIIFLFGMYRLGLMNGIMA